jgi:hypothetical protein
MLLKKSICELAATTNAGHAKLWGKIRGMKKDYYIVEGIVDFAGEEQPPEPFEPRGAGNAFDIKGINEFVYWASNSACGPWV